MRVRLTPKRNLTAERTRLVVRFELEDDGVGGFKLVLLNAAEAAATRPTALLTSGSEA
jgi:hypothetical protein